MRTFDPDFLNSIANRPDVRPWLGGEGPIDLTPLIRNPDNYAFIGPLGGFVVEKLYEGRYECHSIFTPEREGAREVIALMFNSQEFMFTHTDCDELVTKVPEGNMGALGLSRAGKFTESFRRGGVWLPDKKAVSYLTLSLDRWARLCSTAREAGQLFHDTLEMAKKATGSSIPAHPEDELHDRIVGAAVLMAHAGNLVKGVRFYNRWATFAGYRMAEIKTIQPPVVDIGDAVIGLHSGKLEVLLCR